MDKRQIKRAIENILGIKIFKQKSMWRGLCIYTDIERIGKKDSIKTIFDIGANEGQSALAYTDEFKNAVIHSFEPVSDTYRILVENTKHIRKRICIHNLAIGDKTGEADIHLKHLSLINSIKIKGDGEIEKIKLDTLDNISTQLEIDKIDFLKIDVEGYELEVLQGASELLAAKQIRFIQAECSPRNAEHGFVPFSEIDSVLAEYEYDFMGFYEQDASLAGGESVLFMNPLWYRGY